MSPDQQRALALARARRSRAESESQPAAGQQQVAPPVGAEPTQADAYTPMVQQKIVAARDAGALKEDVQKTAGPRYSQFVDQQYDVPQPVGVQPPSVPQAAPPQEEKGFIGNQQESMLKRQAELSQSMTDYINDDMNWAEFALHVGGKGIAGPVLDTTGNLISAVTPDAVKETFASIIDPVVQSKFVQDGIKYYNENTTERQRKNIESGMNLVAIAPSKIAFQKGVTKPTIRKLQNKILVKKRNGFKEGLLKPNNKFEHEDLVGRSFEERSHLSKAYDYMATHKDTNPNRSAQYNIDVINKDFAKAEAELLRELKTTSPIIRPHVLKDKLTANRDALEREFRVIDQDTGKVRKPDLDKKLDFYLSEIDIITKDFAMNPRGLLMARRKFDNWVKEQSSVDLDVDGKQALDIAAKTYRGAINDLINETVGGDRVRTLLNRQSNIYTAKELLQPKAVIEHKAGSKNILQKAGGLAMSHPWLIGGGLLGTGIVSQVASSPAAIGGLTAGVGAFGLSKVPYTKVGVEALNAINKAPLVRGAFYGEPVNLEAEK